MINVERNKKNIMKLYEIPEGSRIKAQCKQRDKILGEYIIFHHPDGMYSYCTVEGLPDEVVHLGVLQELKKSNEGDYYELVSNNE